MICNEEITQMIEDCQKRRFKMNDWERDFISNISKKSSQNLTERQIERLEIIWEKVT